MSSHPLMLNPKPLLRTIVFGLLLPLFSAAYGSLAYGQDFSLTASPLTPVAVNPGEAATSIIDLTATGSFDSPVSLSCTVTSSEGDTGALPTCVVSPASQTPPANGPALTVSTTGNVLAGQYTIIVTGTSGGLEAQTSPLILNVLDVPPDYTLSVSQAISPISVYAGLTAQATITITPNGGYGSAVPPNQVTLACLSVSPTQTASPYCSFTPPTVTVTGGTAPTSVLTITTFGQAATTTASAKPSKWRQFYALWLAVPGLAFVGLGARRGRRNRFLWLFLLLVVMGGFVMLPACQTTNNGTEAPNGDVTPDGTYTFTITAVDANGIVPSNNSTASDAATVSLTVTKAP